MKRKFMKYTLLAVAVATLFVGGVFATRNDFGLGRSMEIMLNLMRVLATQYVDEVDTDKMLLNGADGITSKLDPYSEFIPEDEMPNFEAMTTGRYGGVGALIRKRGDYVVIAEPYKGAPADEAGLKVGDKIVAIDGVSMKDAKVEDISKRLRGEPNTTVTVTIEKLIDGTRQDYTIKRRRIAIPSITYAGYVAKGVGYIRHADFTDKCYDDMRTAILRLQSEGELRSLILDYRNNGGGVLQSAVKVLSLFVPKGTLVVETKGRAKNSKRYHTEYEPLLPDMPLAVLINENSASAAEIVAGAIQDLDRGVLLGGRSFGKGLVQGTAPLGYNAYLKYTVGKYYIPSGRCVQATEYAEGGRAKPVADSLIHEFKTSRGRKVYDGGGVMPDMKVAEPKMNDFTALLYLTGVVEDFCDDYIRRKGTPSGEAKHFSIKEGDYANFMAMVEGRDIPYKSSSRRALESLKSSLDDSAKQSLSVELEAVDKGIKDDKRSMLLSQKDEIVQLINSNLVLRVAYAEGVIANSLPKEVVVNKAIEILNNKEEYGRIITSQDTTRK